MGAFLLEATMRKLIYIGDPSCKPCKHYKETVVDPLMERYPDRIEVHVGHDKKIEEVNARKCITHVPTIVVERDGVEELRFSAFLESEELESIIKGDA